MIVKVRVASESCVLTCRLDVKMAAASDEECASGENVEMDNKAGRPATPFVHIGRERFTGAELLEFRTSRLLNRGRVRG